MSIKYICDVCDHESETRLKPNSRDGLNFDLCKKCDEKLFKLVKRYHYTVTVELEEK